MRDAAYIRTWICSIGEFDEEPGEEHERIFLEYARKKGEIFHSPLKFVYNVLILCQFEVAVLYEPCLDLVSHAVEIDLYSFLSYELDGGYEVGVASHEHDFV